MCSVLDVVVAIQFQMYSKLWVDIHVREFVGAYSQGGLTNEGNVSRLVEFDCKRNSKH